jgi:hypothetical protein
MAFQVRCPECRAKLKLDAEPDADEAIECPKCGTEFDATAARMAGAAAEPKAKAKGGAEKSVQVKEKTAAPPKEKPAPPAPGKAMPKKRRAKKKKSNKAVLTIMLVGALVILAGIGTVAYFLISKSGRQEEILSCVPGECNLVRGVNTGHVYKYTQYKSEGDRSMAGPLRECWDAIASGLSLPAEEAGSPEYAVLAKQKTGGSTSSMIVYRTRKPLSSTTIFSAMGAEVAAGNQTAYRISGSGGLGGSIVYTPTNRLIVVVLRGGQQNDLLQKSVAARQQPENSFWTKMGMTGRKVSGGSIWVIVRTEGGLANYVKDMKKPVESSFGSLPQQMEQTKVFGMWTSFGAKMTFGAALQCDSPEAASTLVSAIRDGPMGKQEDQPEIPNELKRGVHQLQQKEFSEFNSNLKFYSRGDCAYLQSFMTNKDRAGNALRLFGNPGIADSAQE